MKVIYLKCRLKQILKCVILAVFFLMRAFQPVTPLGKLFKNEHIEFPSNKVNKWLSKFLSVSGEGQPFFELHCDRVKVLHDLNSAYYVFDVCGQQ